MIFFYKVRGQYLEVSRIMSLIFLAIYRIVVFNAIMHTRHNESNAHSNYIHILLINPV